MRFVGDSSSEIDAVSERKKSPQAINLEWSPIGVTNRFDQGAGCRIVVVDPAVAKITNPELTFYQHESPRFSSSAPLADCGW